ncbi:uncharacterized protein L969DRAFT_44131 [Mixia osmundae IAM 14324]|uniref:Uncharacterized protein n=1 Tax=Mixia osmundae (strain CBS 9802 / IAM 14324 / JCM 22182 / KY 12970) TaxID=764103 RepID=G7E4K6_MIXOS|nr:uncharacterized protein L969DRAFT_44131 [Mixia osmundae IAM 14324]KEI41854.1 hypothetical protein L969DRAFT_44131 [Mixia osmundae IAM 14324]GAA97766.1 hypothetical protein E5Q_04445 [Mixia osmundae IAM 14324]
MHLTSLLWSSRLSLSAVLTGLMLLSLARFSSLQRNHADFTADPLTAQSDR